MNYLRLTRRWFPLRFRTEQSRAERQIAKAWHRATRFQTIHAGRRSYKTEVFGKRKNVLWLWDCYTHPRSWLDPRRFIAAPTRAQVKKIYWQDIKMMVPRPWVRDVSETELMLR